MKPVSAFDNARTAWLNTYHPFRKGQPKSAPPCPVTAKEQGSTTTPHPADYDPQFHTRKQFHTLPDGTREEITSPVLTERMANELYEAFNRPSYTLDDLTPERIWVTYRVVLSLAMATRAARSGETLLSATETITYDTQSGPTAIVVDPWILPRPLPPKLPLNVLIREANANHPDLSMPDYRHIEALANINETHPDATISLLPPPPPRRWIDGKTQTIRPQYDASNPEHDIDLVLYCGAFRAIYNELGIKNGSRLKPHYGINGYIGLDQADTIRQAFPTTGELLAYEQILITDTLKSLIHTGSVIETIDKLQYDMGFTQREATWIIKMARNHAENLVETDVEVEKNLMILRLEDFIRRTKSTFDIKNEAKALEMLAKIQGITRAEPNDFNSDATKTIAEWNAKSTEKLVRAPIPAHVEATLPPRAEVPQLLEQSPPSP